MFQAIADRLGGIDKVFHFMCGALIAAYAYPFGAMTAVIATLVAAIGKELLDRLEGGKFDVMDAGITFVGGLMSLAVMELVALILVLESV